MIVRAIDNDDTHFLSLYDDTEWQIGKRNGEAVGDAAVHYGEHSGGYYVYPDPDRIMALWESGNLVPGWGYIAGQYALIRCECSGREAVFRGGKRAYTYCRPVEVIARWRQEQG